MSQYLSTLGCHCILVFPNSYVNHQTLVLKVPIMKNVEFTNNIVLSEVAHNEQSHLDLHCLPSILRILNMKRLAQKF